jgi:hypothetical protein
MKELESLVELISAEVHKNWMEMKLAAGVTTRTLDTTGEELMRPYEELSEEAKDLDRGTVRTVLTAIQNSKIVHIEYD